MESQITRNTKRLHWQVRSNNNATNKKKADLCESTGTKRGTRLAVGTEQEAINARVMTPSANLSPRSVLNFLDDEISMDLSPCAPCDTKRYGEKRKLCLSLADADKENERGSKTCRSMNLRHRLVCDQTVEWLAAEERKLEHLWLGPVFESSRTVLAAIETLPATVTHLDLDLRNALHLLPKVMPLLFRNKSHLTSLSIRLFGDSGAMELSKWIHLNPNLKRLDLRDNRIGNDGVRAIAQAIVSCKLSLEHLDLSCNCIVDIDPIEELIGSTTSLETLDLSFNWIGSAEVQKLCKGLQVNTSVRSLNLYGCQRIGHVGIAALLKCLKEHNTSLFQIQVQVFDATSTRLHSALLHWQSLNRAGRCLLRQGGSTQSPLWPLFLAKSNNDPTTLFHILQQGGPLLFHR